jgi:hypothetical protein
MDNKDAQVLQIIANILAIWVNVFYLKQKFQIIGTRDYNKMYGFEEKWKNIRQIMAVSPS